jgi:hypothetical protein
VLAALASGVFIILVAANAFLNARMKTVETSESGRVSGSDKALIKASCSWFSITPTTGALSMNSNHYIIFDVLQSASTQELSLDPQANAEST